jgi:hypothetical protein
MNSRDADDCPVSIAVPALILNYCSTAVRAIYLLLLLLLLNINLLIRQLMKFLVQTSVAIHLSCRAWPNGLTVIPEYCTYIVSQTR